MQRIIVAALLLALGAAAALAQQGSVGDGNADVLNSLMLKASDRCYGLAGGERSACCQRYFDNLCDGREIAATAPPVTPVAAPVAPSPSAPAASMPNRTRNPAGGDGPAAVLNGFVMKEVAQCRPLPPYERRECCEKLLHPNACVE